MHQSGEEKCCKTAENYNERSTEAQTDMSEEGPEKPSTLVIKSSRKDSAEHAAG